LFQTGLRAVLDAFANTALNSLLLLNQKRCSTGATSVKAEAKLEIRIIVDQLQKSRLLFVAPGDPQY